MEKKCGLVEFDGEKYIYGTAAQLYRISRMGGWDAFNKKIVEDVTAKVTEKLVPIITNQIIEELSKPVLKVVE